VFVHVVATSSENIYC